MGPQQKSVVILDDVSISQCEEYVVARTEQHLLVYDMVENRVHAEIGSTEVEPTYCYWISPQKIYFSFQHKPNNIRHNDRIYGTAIFDILTSEIWILMKNKILLPNYSQLFVINNVITAIDNQSITMYDLKTCTKFNKKFDFGTNQFKYQCIEPSSVKLLPFIATENPFLNTDKEKKNYICKCMKFISNSDGELLLIPKKTYTKQTNTGMSENSSDSEPESDYYDDDETERSKYDITLELYVFDLSSNELHATNVLLDVESVDIAYTLPNTEWNWCNSSKFILYMKIEDNINIMECCINSDYDIDCNILSRIPYTKQMRSGVHFVTNASFYMMQYIYKQNLLIKGKCNKREMYRWDKWVTSYYYKHNVISLNNSTDPFKQIDINMESTPFIDQLSGTYFMFEAYDDGANSIYGFSLMKNGVKIGQILHPNTKDIGFWCNKESILNISTSSVVCSGFGIFVGSVFSQQEYLMALQKIHKQNENGSNGFGTLSMALIKLITEFL